MIFSGALGTTFELFRRYLDYAEGIFGHPFQTIVKPIGMECLLL